MRIVTLSPSFPDILKELGSLHNLVGAVADEKNAGEGIQSVGSSKALDLKAIESLRPDLIFASSGENRPEQIQALQKKYRVLSFGIKSISDVADALCTIGRVLRKIDESRILLERILLEENESKKTFKDKSPLPAVLLLWNRPYVTVNFDTYASRLLEASGAWNVFHREPLPEFPVEIEDMIEKEPRILLLATDPYPFKKSHIAGFRKYRVFSGIQIQLLEGRFLSRFGPLTGEALKKIRNIVMNAMNC